MSTSNRANPVLEQNQRLADQINAEALRNPDSPYAGKFVGIANGQVVVVGDTLREAFEDLLRIEPDRSNGLCFKAGVDYDRVEEIWSLK